MTSEMGEFRKRLERFDGVIVIGVAGDSGSGKSTLTKSIRNLLGPDLVATLTLDNYHTEDRETRKKTGHLPLDPAINDLDLAAEHIATLRRGEPILKPVYNHKTGKFDPPEVFEPRKILIVEGLHTFYTPELRKNIDFAVYVDPQRAVKWKWKIKRDVEERGHKKEDVMEEILRREPLYKQYIDPQKVFAEMVIKIAPTRFADLDDAYSVRVIQEIINLPIEEVEMGFNLAALIRKSRMPFSIEYRSDYYYGKPVTEITVDGKIHKSVVEDLERKIQQYTGFEEHTLWERDKKYINGIMLSQLMICWRFVEKMNTMLREIEEAAKRLGEG